MTAACLLLWLISFTLIKVITCSLPHEPAIPLLSCANKDMPPYLHTEEVNSMWTGLGPNTMAFTL